MAQSLRLPLEVAEVFPSESLPFVSLETRPTASLSPLLRIDRVGECRREVSRQNADLARGSNRERADPY